MPSDVPGTATEIDQNHMQYVAVRARGASKHFLSCIVKLMHKMPRHSVVEFGFASRGPVGFERLAFLAALRWFPNLAYTHRRVRLANRCLV